MRSEALNAKRCFPPKPPEDAETFLRRSRNDLQAEQQRSTLNGCSFLSLNANGHLRPAPWRSHPVQGRRGLARLRPLSARAGPPCRVRVCLGLPPCRLARHLLVLLRLPWAALLGL